MAEKTGLFGLILALAFLLVAPAFSACNSNSVSERQCMTLSQARAAIPAWMEDDSLDCNNNDACCGDSRICMVKMVNNTPLCQSTAERERKCAANAPSSEWSTDSSLSCNAQKTCCPNLNECYYLRTPPDPTKNVTVRLSPVSAQTGDLRLYCKAQVRVVQDNGMPCFSEPNLTVRLGSAIAQGVVKVLHSFDHNTQEKKCTWVWNVTKIENQGTYNFSFWNSSKHIRSNSTWASATANVSCAPQISNCTAFCNANSSVQFSFLGCGVSPCGPTQAKLVKDCLYNCPDYSICTSEAPQCVPKVSLVANVFNLTPWNFSVSLSANFSGYTLPPSRVEFFLDGKIAGSDQWIPYYLEVPVMPKTNHSAYAQAIFPFGTFKSNSTNFSVGARKKIEPYVSCDRYCPGKDSPFCTCSVFHCQSVGNGSIRSELTGEESAITFAQSNFSAAFIPNLYGNHTVKAECLESEIGEVPLSFSLDVPKKPYYFTLLPDSSCGIPDNRSCSISLYSHVALPTEFRIIGSGKGGYALSEAVLVSSGWKGNRTINFTSIEYVGAGPFEARLFAYEPGMLSKNPANYVYSRLLFSK